MLVGCSIDATEEVVDGPKLGRLVNHGDSAKKRNAVMKILDGPVLALFATKDIKPDDEILYNYGIKVPWKKVSSVVTR